jgi:hypothetical protein
VLSVCDGEGDGLGAAPPSDAEDPSVPDPDCWELEVEAGTVIVRVHDEVC